jgi:hypothetical protein
MPRLGFCHERRSEVSVGFARIHLEKSVPFGQDYHDDPGVPGKQVVAHREGLPRHSILVGKDPPSVVPEAPKRCVLPAGVALRLQLRNQEIEDLRVSSVKPMNALLRPSRWRRYGLPLLLVKKGSPICDSRTVHRFARRNTDRLFPFTFRKNSVDLYRMLDGGVSYPRVGAPLVSRMMYLW